MNPYLETLKPVWQNTDYVQVNEERLKVLIDQMRKADLVVPSWDVANVQPPVNCGLTEWLNYICWINTINFAFTNFEPPWNKFTVEHPQKVFWKGAFALGASFMRALEDGAPIFDAAYMSKIPFGKVQHIFRSSDYQHFLPGLEIRWQILREVGEVLLEKYNGHWLNLFWESDWRAFNGGRGVVEQLVANFPSFRDWRFFKGHYLGFQKRAQLLVMMYYGRAVNSGGRFPLVKDIKDIGPITDYDVPKGLRASGVLDYSPAMEEAIKNRQVFQPGDPQEIENRLATAYAMDLICRELGILMAQADFYVWGQGRNSAEPHILVMTTDY